jgi:hypothetical protein
LVISSGISNFALASSGFGAVGSAHVWGARGRWFESSNPDLIKKRAVSCWISAFFLVFKALNSRPNRVNLGLIRNKVAHKSANFQQIFGSLETFSNLFPTEPDLCQEYHQGCSQALHGTVVQQSGRSRLPFI